MFMSFYCFITGKLPIKIYIFHFFSAKANFAANPFLAKQQKKKTESFLCSAAG